MNDFVLIDSVNINELTSYRKREYVNEYDFRLDVFKTLHPKKRILSSIKEFYVQSDRVIFDEFKAIFHKEPYGIKRLTAITLMYDYDFIPYFRSLSDVDFKNEFYNTVNNIGPHYFLFVKLRRTLAENAFKDSKFCDWLFSFSKRNEHVEWVISSMIKIACKEMSQEKISYIESKVCCLQNVEIFTSVLFAKVDYNKCFISWVMSFLSKYRVLTRTRILEMIATAAYKKQSIQPIVEEVKNYTLFSSYQDLVYSVRIDQDYFSEDRGSYFSKETVINEISKLTGITF